MIYRPFQYYLDKANGDTELATKLELLAREEIHKYKELLLDRISKEAEQEIKEKPEQLPYWPGLHKARNIIEFEQFGLFDKNA